MCFEHPDGGLHLPQERQGRVFVLNLKLFDIFKVKGSTLRVVQGLVKNAFHLSYTTFKHLF